MQKLEASRLLNANYGDVDNFIVHFGTSGQPLEWQTVAFVDGRFILTFVVPVTVDYSKRTVTKAGACKFYLQAIEKVIAGPGIPDEGGWGCIYDTKLQTTFAMDEWTKFVSSGFDLTSLGIPEDEIYSIPHWKEYVRACRKDRVSIK